MNGEHKGFIKPIFPSLPFFAIVKHPWTKFSARLLHLWERYEKYLFIGLLFVNLIPILGVQYFFTGDGPAHLYNSNLILQLLENPAGEASRFFELRYELIPNLGGHVLLTFLNAFLPASIAEKIIYGLCLLMLPLGFRYLVSSLKKEATPLSYLIFPLAHNFCFYIGFQSFCLGLALMFFAVGYYFKTRQSKIIAPKLTLAALLFITAIFHLFTAVVALMAIGVFLLVDLFKSRFRDWREGLVFTVIAIPAAVFCGLFLLQNSGEGFQINQTGFSQLLKGIVAGIPIITIDTAETRFSQPFNILLCSGLAIAIVQRVKGREGFGAKDFAILTSLLLFFLYFIMPDSLASGGFISLRLLLCAYLFLALWVVLFMGRHLLAMALVGAVVFLNLKLVHYHWLKAKELSADVAAIYQATAHIPQGSTVIPLNYSYHWLHYNIGLYLGGEKDLIILDNYEANTPHFPVKWKEGMYPGNRLGDFTSSHRPLLQLKPYEDFMGDKVNAVVRWQHSYEMTDSLTLLTDSLLKREFKAVYVSPAKDVEVFLRKEDDN